jgi:hypothetical protein
MDDPMIERLVEPLLCRQHAGCNTETGAPQIGNAGPVTWIGIGAPTTTSLMPAAIIASVQVVSGPAWSRAQVSHKALRLVDCCLGTGLRMASISACGAPARLSQPRPMIRPRFQRRASHWVRGVFP